jgi:cytochrome c oxidase subunit 3
MGEIVYDKNNNAHEVVDFNDDIEGARQGMWLFLFTELMLFGGIFIMNLFILRLMVFNILLNVIIHSVYIKNL